jgi:hypothetical protein
VLRLSFEGQNAGLWGTPNGTSAQVRLCDDEPMPSDPRITFEAALASFVHDVRHTLDPGFEVSLSLGDDEWMWSVYGTGRGLIPELPRAAMVAWFAQDIPENAFDEVLEPWPRCPIHLDHPLYPEVRPGQAVWACHHDNQVTVEIGSLDDVGSTTYGT